MGEPQDPLETLVDQLLESLGEGCDITVIEIELRERGPERTEASESLAETAAELDRAGQDAAEVARGDFDLESPSVSTAVMDHRATLPPENMSEIPIDQSAIDGLNEDLDAQHEAYEQDPESFRPDSVSGNAAAAAYFAFRTACVAWDRFNRRAARALEILGELAASPTARRVVEGVIIAVSATLITAAILGS
ncbi:MAG: hypothetical protein AAFR38_01720 [Planctomycetota bacterium]